MAMYLHLPSAVSPLEYEKMTSHLPGHRNEGICCIQAGLWSLSVREMSIYSASGYDPYAPSQVQGHRPVNPLEKFQF